MFARKFACSYPVPIFLGLETPVAEVSNECISLWQTVQFRKNSLVVNTEL